MPKKAVKKRKTVQRSHTPLRFKGALCVFLPPKLKNRVKALNQKEQIKFLDEYSKAVKNVVTQLGKHRVNKYQKTQTQSSIRIPGTEGTFINLETALKTAAGIAVPLVASAAIFSAPLAAIGIVTSSAVTFSSVSSGATALVRAFKKLAADEIDTYSAVAEAIRRNGYRALGTRGATLEQIRKSFRDDKDLMEPQDLDKMLSQLDKKGVIKGKVEGGKQQYFLAF